MKLISFFLTLLFIQLFSNAQQVNVEILEVLEEEQSFKIVVDGEPTVARVSPGDVKIYSKGQQVRGSLALSDGTVWLNKLWPLDEHAETQMNAINQVLHADTAVRQRRDFRKVKDAGINFSMINEQGKFVEFDQYKGKWVIMNFIFTRCRMPEMCPAQTARMVSLQRMAKKNEITNLQQLSVTFDPKYDTPGILNEYAYIKGADTETFSFLTGPYEVMLDILKQYGVIAYDSKNIIDHTVTTLLFDPNGKIVLRRDGTMWKEKNFIKRIQKGIK